MDYTCLMELPIKGGTFTWSNRRSEDEAILEKLDRVMVSCEWSLNFPKAIGILDVALASDHTPIVLMLKGANKKYKREFKFEAKWLLEEECSSNIRVCWQSGGRRGNNQGFGLKLCRTRSKLMKWSKLKYRRIKEREKELKNRIQFLQDRKLNKVEMEELNNLKLSLDHLWESEERH
ncbi:hypothetical protein V6N12_038028 [Hibiscus sabdariffa]|uniref:Endonuclease/exonuclease/phosphatase domain-containing protein n=1 Tax=Hibiscus sabdariffa TaxID=183260 RepID=A0ABR2BWD8_9ROSI